MIDIETKCQSNSAGIVPLFDTHCHLDFAELGLHLAAVLDDALAAGVVRMLVPGVSPARWSLQWELQQWVAQQGIAIEIDLALGVHPWWQQDATDSAFSQLETLLRDCPQQICAIGECGLDFALDWLEPDRQVHHRQQQLAVLDTQIELAQRYHKPLILHHRKSQADVLQRLKVAGFSQGGILHAFSGSQAQAHAFMDLGFALGIGGTISYERASKTRDTVKKLPLEALVLETDAPAMPLSGYQGQVNHPAMARRVFDILCQLRAEPPRQIAQQLWQTSARVLTR